MEFDYIQFLLYTEKNKRETNKINKLIKGLSDEVFDICNEVIRLKSEE